MSGTASITPLMAALSQYITAARTPSHGVVPTAPSLSLASNWHLKSVCCIFEEHQIHESPAQAVHVRAEAQEADGA